MIDSCVFFISLIDSTSLMQDVVRKGTSGWKKVVKAFGNDILLENGEIDRARLGQIVFTDATKRQLLNRYVSFDTQVQQFCIYLLSNIVNCCP